MNINIYMYFGCDYSQLVVWKQYNPHQLSLVVPNPGPIGNTTMHILHVSFLWYTDSLLMCWWPQSGVFKEICTTGSVGVSPGPGLETTELVGWTCLFGPFTSIPHFIPHYSTSWLIGPVYASCQLLTRPIYLTDFSTHLQCQWADKGQ